MVFEKGWREWKGGRRENEKEGRPVPVGVGGRTFERMVVRISFCVKEWQRHFW